MRYAIVESGGKQYRAVEGESIEVDRLAVETGKKIDLDRILLMADGEDVMVGTPTVSGIEVKAIVLDHFRGPKVFRFKYSPKKRIRVRGGHRQQYTRLLVDFIGKPGEERKIEKPVKKELETKAEKAPVAEKPAKAPAKEAKKAEAKAPAKKAPVAASPKVKKSTSGKSAEKKPATPKKSSKK
jgi:large subunit ribosomal protein L21